MGGIQQCVKDVVSIANKTEDFGQAKTRIEQLFAASKVQHRGHLAVAQRVRNLNRAYDDVGLDAQPFAEASGHDCLSACDVVDGVRSRQGGPIRVIVVNESHQGAAPCKLQRSVWISPRTCFRFMRSTQPRRSSFASNCGAARYRRSSRGLCCTQHRAGCFDAQIARGIPTEGLKYRRIGSSWRLRKGPSARWTNSPPAIAVLVEAPCRLY
jgi:hypothetical protein